MNVCDHLKHLEETLLLSAVRKDQTQVSALLAEDFREIGSSGRSFSRAGILEELQTEATQRHVTLSNFECSVLSETLALVTYRTVRQTSASAQRSALRSSLWVLRDARWQILFHQGTPVP